MLMVGLSASLCDIGTVGCFLLNCRQTFHPSSKTARKYSQTEFVIAAFLDVTEATELDGNGFSVAACVRKHILEKSFLRNLAEEGEFTELVYLFEDRGCVGDIETVTAVDK